MCEVITVYCQVKVMIDIIANGLPFTSCLSLTLPTHTPAPQPLPGIRVAGGCLFCFLCSRPPGFDSCPCLSPGEPSLRKRSSESALQHQPPAKTVVRCDLTGSERSVDAVGVSSSAPVVSRGAVAAERSPPICEGELCGVFFPSMMLSWNRPCPFAVLGVLCGVMCLCSVRSNCWCMCFDVSPHV